MSSTTNIKDIIKEEFKKCASSPDYFITKYCKIKHPMRGVVPFELYGFQSDLLQKMKIDDRIIILKSRQMGISTLTAAYSLWYMIFHEYKTIYTVATKLKVAKNLVDKVRIMHQYLPSWLKPEMIEDNKLTLRYANGSAITAGTSSSDEGRSEAVSLFIIDEMAFVPSISTLWSAIQPTLATGGRMILLSTPNGVGNLFHQIYSNAINGNNGFTPVELHWSLHPERDQIWRDKQERELGSRLAAQELDCSFLSSGDTVFDIEKLEDYIKENVKDPIDKPMLHKGVWIWETPLPNKKYMLSADVSRGDGEDFSAFHIIDLETLTQVVEFNGKISTSDFANLCINYATMYNDAVLIPENTGLGWATVQAIMDRGYKNLFYSTDAMKYNDPNKPFKIAKPGKSTPGFTMSSTSRPLVIDKLITLFENGEVHLRSSRLIDQMKVFIWNNGKAEAMKGYNDDMIMALAIGLYVRELALLRYSHAANMTKGMLNAVQVDYDDKTAEVVRQRNKNKYIASVTGKAGKHVEDFSWLQ